MIKALELVNKSRGIDKYFFCINDREVKVGDVLTCKYAGIDECKVFQIYDGTKIGEHLFDLGRNFLGCKPSAETIAEFVDRCKLKVDDIQFYHGPIMCPNGIEQVLDVMFVYLKK